MQTRRVDLCSMDQSNRPTLQLLKLPLLMMSANSFDINKHLKNLYLIWFWLPEQELQFTRWWTWITKVKGILRCTAEQKTITRRVSDFILDLEFIRYTAAHCHLAQSLGSFTLGTARTHPECEKGEHSGEQALVTPGKSKKYLRHAVRWRGIRFEKDTHTHTHARIFMNTFSLSHTHAHVFSRTYSHTLSRHTT